MLALSDAFKAGGLQCNVKMKDDRSDLPRSVEGTVYTLSDIRLLRIWTVYEPCHQIGGG